MVVGTCIGGCLGSYALMNASSDNKSSYGKSFLADSREMLDDWDSYFVQRRDLLVFVVEIDEKTLFFFYHFTNRKTQPVFLFHQSSMRADFYIPYSKGTG